MKPNTRKEMFLDAIADGEPCNLVPANRKELLLQRMAENAGGGGGGGAGVVVNCTLCWEDSSLNRIDGDFAVVSAAIESGKMVYGYIHEIGTDGSVYAVYPVFPNYVMYDEGKPSRVDFLNISQQSAASLCINPEDNYIGENNG